MLSSSTNSNMTKKKYNKNKKKSVHTTHPYVDLIQTEIAALEDKLKSFEESKTPLTDEQQTDRLVTKACLERYQDTLNKTSDPTFISKVSNHQNTISEESKKKQEFQFLTTMQLFYLMRLGQLGLFEFMEPTTVVPLESIADLCDQMIGAAVHFANEQSSKAKHENKLKVFTLIRKLDTAADEVITANDKTTFKQVKEFLDHLWKHTKPVEGDHQQDYPMLQFDTMMPLQQPSKDEHAQTDESKQHDETMQDVKVEQHHEPVQAEQHHNEQPETPDTSLSTSSTTQEQPTNQVKKDEGWGNVQIKGTKDGWGSSEDPNKKCAWGNDTPINQMDHIQSTEKSHNNKNLTESSSNTTSASTKSLKGEKKKKSKKDKEKSKKEEVKSEEPKEVEVKKEQVSRSVSPKAVESKEPEQKDGDWDEKSTKKPTKKDNWKQTGESDEWTSFDTTTIKEGGWDSPGESSKPTGEKDWEELKNNFGTITLTEDPPIRTEDTDDSWKQGHFNDRGRGRGRGQRGRGRGRGEFRGGFRGTRPPRGRGHRYEHHE